MTEPTGRNHVTTDLGQEGMRSINIERCSSEEAWRLILELMERATIDLPCDDFRVFLYNALDLAIQT